MSAVSVRWAERLGIGLAVLVLVGVAALVAVLALAGCAGRGDDTVEGCTQQLAVQWVANVESDASDAELDAQRQATFSACDQLTAEDYEQAGYAVAGLPLGGGGGDSW